MKLKPLILMLVALGLSACNKKNTAIQNELKILEKTAKDTSQTKYIRESAGTFAEFLSEKQEISQTKLSRAHWAMACDPDPTVIVTYVAFLKALEKQIPEKLPSVEAHEVMKSKVGRSEIVEYTLAQTVFMMSSSIKNISHYGDPAADAEVDRVLKRIKEKHGTSKTGQIIMERLNMERQQGLNEQKRGIKPWQSPRRPEVYEPGPVD
jgi:hypothetical protein